MRCEAPHCTNVALHKVLDGDVMVHACSTCGPVIEAGIAERDAARAKARAELRDLILRAVLPDQVATVGTLRRKLANPPGLLAELRALVAEGVLESVPRASGVLAVRLPVAPTPTPETPMPKPKTPTEEDVLTALKGGATVMGELVDKLGSTDSTLRNRLRSLQKQGLVVAKGATSARSYHPVDAEMKAETTPSAPPTSPSAAADTDTDTREDPRSDPPPETGDLASSSASAAPEGARTRFVSDEIGRRVEQSWRKVEEELRKKRVREEQERQAMLDKERSALAADLAAFVKDRRVHLAQVRHERELLAREEMVLKEEIEALESLLEGCA